MNTGINRIRLEFKVVTHLKGVQGLVVLIESDWNLKQNNKEIADIVAERINRIRLEFKGLTDIQSGTRCIVLIESDWNLKLYQYRDQIEVVEVLIESDWNLKA